MAPTLQVTDDLIEITLAVAASSIEWAFRIPWVVPWPALSAGSLEHHSTADVVVQIRPDQIDGLVDLLGADESAADCICGSSVCGWSEAARVRAMGRALESAARRNYPRAELFDRPAPEP